MSKEKFKAERLYQATMSMARNMLLRGLISEEEYRQIDTIFLEKYRPVFGTLFSDPALTFGANRVIYSGGQEGIYAENY